MILFDVFFSLIIFVSFFFCAQLLLGLSRTNKSNHVLARGRCAVLIPAHNEQVGIGATLASAKHELEDGDIIVVVADNCSDKTAEVCRQEGVTCTERFNTSEVGKGYALQYGVDYIKSLDESYSTIVVMDADCEFKQGALNKLASIAENEGCVAQALYLMKSSNKNNVKLNISEFTWLIKNWVRPLGQHKLGISCHLQGSGMAFPMHMFNEFSLASSSIVEDLELGLNIAASGGKIKFIQDAEVVSYFPENTEGLDIQRKRWEHGHLSIVAKMPKVMFKALTKLNFRLFFQALDAAIPPTVMWTALLLLAFAMSFVFGLFATFHWALLFFINVTIYVLALALCWHTYGRDIIGTNQLKGLIPFVLGKLSIYKAFVANREKTWVRTKRDDE